MSWSEHTHGRAQLTSLLCSSRANLASLFCPRPFLSPKYFNAIGTSSSALQKLLKHCPEGYFKSFSFLVFIDWICIFPVKSFLFLPCCTMSLFWNFGHLLCENENSTLTGKEESNAICWNRFHTKKGAWNMLPLHNYHGIFAEGIWHNQQKYEQEEMCLNEIWWIWNPYRDHESSQEGHTANSSCNHATILAEMAPSVSKISRYKVIMYRIKKTFWKMIPEGLFLNGWSCLIRFKSKYGKGSSHSRADCC